MIKEVDVEGYDNFWKAVKENEVEAKKKGIPLVIIIKSSTEKDGKSWCRDCSLLDKMLEDKLKSMGLSGIILKAKAGTFEQWLSDNNRFKTDKVLGLEAIPTVYRWKDGKPQKRMEVPDVLSPEKFKSLFAD